MKSQGICIVDDCSNTAITKGMCKKHYTRVLRNGDPYTRKNLAYEPLHVRLNNYTINGDGCWEWDGYLNNKGYGTLYYEGSKKYVHRLSFMNANAITLSEGECVLHKCDNPKCINPHHLFKGTHKDNYDDCVSKGRHAHGDKNATRLTTEMVKFIRAMNSKGFRQRDIIAHTGLHQSTVSAVINRITWKHI